MQKKHIGVIYILFSVLLIICVWSINNVPLFSDYGKETELYLKNYSSECKIIKTDKTGFLAEIYKTGEATVINNSDVDRILKDFSAETVFYEEVGDITEIYAFSKKIRYKKSVGGKIVNLHIIKNKTTIKVGSPIIFGSF